MPLFSYCYARKRTGQASRGGEKCVAKMRSGRAYSHSIREGEVHLSAPGFHTILVVLVTIALADAIQRHPRHEVRGASAAATFFVHDCCGTTTSKKRVLGIELFSGQIKAISRAASCGK